MKKNHSKLQNLPGYPGNGNRASIQSGNDSIPLTISDAMQMKQEPTRQSQILNETEEDIPVEVVDGTLETGKKRKFFF